MRDEYADLRGKLTVLEAAYTEITAAFGGESVTAMSSKRWSMT